MWRGRVFSFRYEEFQFSECTGTQEIPRRKRSGTSSWLLKSLQQTLFSVLSSYTREQFVGLPSSAYPQVPSHVFNVTDARIIFSPANSAGSKGPKIIAPLHFRENLSLSPENKDELRCDPSNICQSSHGTTVRTSRQKFFDETSWRPWRIPCKFK